MKHYQHHFQAMGSPCQLQLFVKNKQMAKRAVQTVIKEIQRQEAKYSRYLDDSFLSEINRNAGDVKGIRVDTETAALLDYADNCYQQSEGLFDISAGVLAKAWDFKRNRLPEKSLVESLLKRVGWDKIQWRSPYLYLPKGMALDFGGIVKEYAVDTAVGLCQQQGITSGLIELGGDVRAIGAMPEGQAWQIGIAHPRKPKQLLTHLQLYSGAIASSGDYERYIEVDGQRYCHILNPKTGYPIDSQYLHSVTVIAEHCVVAGSLATIAQLKQADGKAWLAQSGCDYICY